MTSRALGVLLLLTAQTANASPCLDASRILHGQAAACDGVLVPESNLLRIRQNLELCYLDVEECQTLRQADVEEHQLRVANLTSVLALAEEKAAALEQAALAALEPPTIPWFEHPAFVASVSVVLTVLASIGVYALADHLAEH